MNMEIDRHQAFARMRAFAMGGKLRQRVWNATKCGQEVACFLGASAATVTGIDTCPGNLAPRWVLECIPDMFDGMPAAVAIKPATAIVMIDAWEKMRGADDPRWEAARRRWFVYLVRTAMEAARPSGVIPNYWPAVEAACLQSISAIESGGKAAAEAERAATRAAAEATRAATRAAARAATRAAAKAAWAAAKAAAEAADAAAEAADAAADAAAEAAAKAAWAAARDRQWIELASIISECAEAGRE